MSVTTTRVWVIAALLGLLGVGLTLVQVAHAQSQCPPNSEQDFCSDSYWLQGNLSPISDRSNSADAEYPSIENPTLPSAGALIYSDYVKIEQRARELLSKAMLMRESISPYREDNNFETFLRALNARAGWEDDPLPVNVPGYEATSFTDLVTQIERDLTEARDLYAFLAVFAPEADFRKDNAYINNNGVNSFCGAEDKEDPNPQADPSKPTVLPPVVDWCNFQARLRQSVREVVNVRMIVGQEFMVDALGTNFSSDLIGVDQRVKAEVAQLHAARYQFERAEAFLADGLKRAVGNGCLVSDFYTQAEWSLLSLAAARQGTSQYHLAIRESYLNVGNAQSAAQAQTVAQQTFRQSANDTHIKLIGLVGLGAPVAQHCQVVGTRPDGALVAELALNQAETRRRSQEMAAGLNIFGFDVTMTPNHPYNSSTSRYCQTLAEGTLGLWDLAWCMAEEAQTQQDRAESTGRFFDTSQEKLNAAIDGIRNGLDLEIFKVAGCEYDPQKGDAGFFDCTQKQIDAASTCWQLAAIDSAVDATKLDPPAKYADFEACMVHVMDSTDFKTALRKLRSDYLAFQAIKKSAENINEQIQNSNDANATVTKWLGIAGTAEGLARVAQAALDTIACIDIWASAITFGSQSAGCIGVGTTNAVLQGTAGALSTAADVEIANAENIKESKNLLLQMSELLIDAQSVRQSFLATQSDVGGLIDLLRRNMNEAQRQRAYFAVSPANNPSFRIVRDSARLQFAEALEKAARFSYLAARRAEYEYAARLAAADSFAISDIYRARTAQDIKDYLVDLRAATTVMAGSATTNIEQTDLKISVAQDILLLTDALLISEGFNTPEAITAERTRRFRLWVAENTVRNENNQDDKPVLRFTFSTSLLNGGLFSNIFGQTNDLRWLLKLTKVDPLTGSNGVSINLVSDEMNLSHRFVQMSQGGTVHLKSFAGCIFDYRLIAPAALLGREWPDGQPAETVTATFTANVNDSHAYTESGYRTSAFGGRAISATDWKIAIFAVTPQASLGLPDMDLQQLTDIQLNLSATYASRTGNQNQQPPNPVDCARIDY